MAKIMVIDDEDHLCGFIKQYFEKRGYEIVVAMTGKDSLSLYPKENPDLVLLDLGLPDMNGRVILKDIKAKMPQIKVMVISAYDDQATRDELTMLGADYFVGKPFIIAKLLETVQEVLKN